MSAPLGADEVAAILSLVPLPEEGGRWAQTVLDGDSSAIHYLLTDGDFSAMHRLDGQEVYHHYAGAPAALLLLFGRALRRVGNGPCWAPPWHPPMRTRVSNWADATNCSPTGRRWQGGSPS